MKHSRQTTVEGKLSCHPAGYGFVAVEGDWDKGDIFIPRGRLGAAVDGDQVVVRLVESRRRSTRRGKEKSPRGEILEVISRARRQVLGKIFRYREEVLAAPLDKRYHYPVRIADRSAESIADGIIVSVEITAHPSTEDLPFGTVVEILGDADDPEIQYRIVCHNFEIPVKFSDAVLDEASQCRPPSAADLRGRADYRREPILTIDGESARDFDDAVSLQPLEQGRFLLGVHIADVSKYVEEGSLLDQEAYRRGTSVYFPDRAVAMLPENLSNRICSLQPSQDRLTVSVWMELEPSGKITRVRFENSVICSRARMTYTEVQKILVDRDPELLEKYRPLVPVLDSMYEVSQILNRKRKSRGSIDFDLPEAEIVYDVGGEILDIVRSEQNEAHRLIEEFMLAANESVARFLNRLEVPFLYRIHESPDPGKVEEFLETAVRFGYGLERSGKEEYASRDFQKLVERLKGKKEEKFLTYLMLRSFQQARYSTRNEGHFGLACPLYTHFTSPIRRYPDLVVHRILKAALVRSSNSPLPVQLDEQLEETARHCSVRERQAMEAEREIMRWLMAEFMADRLGEEYEGFITGVRENGFFVELLDHFVEGFVPVSTLWDDYYIYHPKDHCLIGENTRRSFRIGNSVRVRVDKVDPDRHLIDFSAVLTAAPGKPGSSSRPTSKKKRSRR